MTDTITVDTSRMIRREEAVQVLVRALSSETDEIIAEMVRSGLVDAADDGGTYFLGAAAFAARAIGDGLEAFHLKLGREAAENIFVIAAASFINRAMANDSDNSVPLGRERIAELFRIAIEKAMQHPPVQIKDGRLVN